VPVVAVAEDMRPPLLVLAGPAAVVLVEMGLAAALQLKAERMAQRTLAAVVAVQA
jgi:hypothetical protein